MTKNWTRVLATLCGGVLVSAAVGCGANGDVAQPHASGYVEATEVRVSAKVPGRLLSIDVAEGDRVVAGQELIRLSATDATLALGRLRAEREQAVAQLRLLRAGAREEDIRQAEAQAAAAASERETVATELAAAIIDADRYQQLVDKRAGATKQRDDAMVRKALAEKRLKTAEDRVAAANATVASVKAGARPEEIDAAQARLAAVDAQIATLENDISESVVTAPSSGVVSARLVEPGELVAPRVPLLVIIDLDRAWATAYVEEPRVASLSIGQSATVLTDAGDRLTGQVSFIAPQAEFTPRNVQTASERAKLVYRVRVSVNNEAGTLKPGMPVEVDFGGNR